MLVENLDRIHLKVNLVYWTLIFINIFLYTVTVEYIKLYRGMNKTNIFFPCNIK